MGRFAIQLMVFFFMTVFMFALAIPYNHWTLPPNRISFVVIYSLTFFFANFGPNATIKVGAIVGAFGFMYAAQSKHASKTYAGYPPGIGIKSSFMLGVINFVGMIFTFLVPESKGKSLEELTCDNEEGSETEQTEAEAPSNREVSV